jgi:hypothetical protein
MAEHKSDERVLAKIQELVHEEHTLRAGTDLDNHAQTRLDTIGVELDQCWDLLRQRRARRAAGQNPDGAQVRDEKIVENYIG